MKTKLLTAYLDGQERALDFYTEVLARLNDTCANRIQLTELERWPGSDGGEVP